MSQARKTVTVLFSDVSGSTRFGEQFDPESIRGVMNRYFDEMRAILERHGGTVEKFIGDAVMAVFGIPTLHEDDALRAVRAAAEIRESVTSLNEQLTTEWGVTLQFRTGINTGDVLAGDPSQGQAFATGDAVNVAARLEQLAAPGEILLGRDTYSFVRDAVETEEVDPLSMKGKSEPVRAYKLLDVHASSGFPERFDSPLVGRRHELDRLHAAFDGSQKQRSSRLATVLGDAGVGKSRLADEFVRAVADRATVLRGRCPSYGQGMTFWPISEVVRQAAAITDMDTPRQAHAKTARLLSIDLGDAELVAERVLSLFGVGESNVVIQESFWALRKFFEALARKQPLVLVFDDLHWAEPGFLDFLDYALDFGKDAPMLFLCTARPEFLDTRPSWTTLHPGALSLTLGPMENAESHELIENLLGADSPADVRERIWHTAQGNPLFIEQTVRMMIDERQLMRDGAGWVTAGGVSEIPVPATINLLLAARLDTLSTDERDVLQGGSVVGQVFWWGSAAEMSSAKDRVGQHLQSLIRKQLLRPSGESFPEEDGFRFSHALIRDVAYNAIPKARRAELHERFARWLGRKTEGRIAEYEEIMAYHLEQAYQDRVQLRPADAKAKSLAKEGAERLRSAARRAFTRGDLSAADKLFERAATLIPDTDPDRPGLLLEIAEMWPVTGNYALAHDLLADVVTSAASFGDHRLRLHAEVERAFFDLSFEPQGSVERALTEAERALPLLEEDGDDLGLCKAWILRGAGEATKGHFERMRRAYEKALVYARRCGDERRETDIRESILTAQELGATPVDQIIPECEVELRRCQKKGYRFAASGMMVHLARLYAQQGRFETARDFIARSSNIIEDLGIKYRPGLSWTSGLVELLADNDARAEQDLRVSYETLKEAGESGFLSTLATSLGEALYKLGRFDDAEECCRVSEEAADQGDVVSQVRWRWLRGMITARRGGFDEAVALVKESLSLTEDTDDLNTRADALMAAAEVMPLANRADEAPAYVRQALRLYEQKGNVATATKARRLVEELG